jgi:hypothetical protein
VLFGEFLAPMKLSAHALAKVINKIEPIGAEAG